MWWDGRGNSLVWGHLVVSLAQQPLFPVVALEGDDSRHRPGGSVYIQDFSDRLVREFQAVEPKPERTDPEPLPQFQRHGVA